MLPAATLLLRLLPAVVRDRAPGDCEFGYGCAALSLSAGAVRGNVWSHGEEYLVIPYATAARFEPPRVRTKLPGGAQPFDATNILGHGQAACMQPNEGDNASQITYGREDCLFLNLYRPHSVRERQSGPAPIMLWVFGGDNTLSEIIPYNATQLAGRHDAIVAVVSYRLGALGFAAFEGDVHSSHGTGNAGMYDVLAAATWLKREAHNLGGDPDSIIVFGESSGGTDAQLMTMAPPARGLITGSIGESGGLYAHSLNDSLKTTLEVALKVGCDGIFRPMKECMQGKDIAAIVQAAGNSDWGPTVDGVFLIPSLNSTPLVVRAGGRLLMCVSA
jgi:para-nitrobenzyl esterase